jgi:hypothetical protein
MRYQRQLCLNEVGEAGQARLEASEVRLACEGDARGIEEIYLRYAGVRVREAEGKADTIPFDTAALAPLALRDPAALAVATGAMSALVSLRAVLGVADGA